MADIFVSYSRKDLAFARALAASLSARGWSVWWDRDIPAGRTFDEVIAEALAGARCVIVVWSKDSISSDWVREEADEGRRRDILVPILIDDVRPPLGFGRIQAADLRGWDGDDSSEGFDKLVTDIRALLGPPPSHLSAPPPLAPTVPSPTVVASSPDGVVADVTTTPTTAPPVRSKTNHLRRLPNILAGRRRLVAATLAVAALVIVAAYRFGPVGDPSQPRPITSAAAAPALRLNAVLNEGAEPIAEGVAYQVFEVDQDAEGNRTRVKGSGVYEGPPRFALTPRRYFVTATYGSASAGTEVEVEAATLTMQTLNLRAGIVRPLVSLADNGKPLPEGVGYTVSEAATDVEGNRKRIAGSGIYEGPPRFVLPAGRYLVTVTHGSASRSVEVDVAAGEIKTLPVALQAGILNLSSRLTAGAPTLAEGVGYDVYEAAADGEGKRKRITGSGIHEGPPRLPLPAGRYFVTAKHGSAIASGEIDLRAGEIRPLVLDLGAGVLTLQAIAPGGGDPLKEGVSYQVYQGEPDGEGKRTSVVRSGPYEGPPRFPLPAGRYYVEASAKDGKADAEVTLRAGELRQLPLRLRP
jgi:hypothetical protein